jgi:hypothetical protein
MPLPPAARPARAAHRPATALAAACLLALAAAPAAASNLIVNGDFSAGATGFITDYPLTASGCIGCAGVAASTLGWYNQPALVFPFGDHTTGSGLMLLYDPPPSGAPRLWQQTVNVSAGTTYAFSGWIREANAEPSPNNGRVQVSIDGTVLGTQDAPDNIWAQWSFQWTAQATGPVVLLLRDVYPTTFNGTYSAIDDLVFAPVPEPGAAVLMAVGLVSLGWRSRRRPPKR